MAKLQKISKIALNFLKVFKILAIAVLLLGIAVPVFFLFLPAFDSPTSLLFGDLQLMLSERIHLEVPPLFCVGILLISVLNAVAALRIIFHLQNILKPMTEGRPFHNQIAPSIRKIGWLYMISTFLTQVTSCAVSAFTFQQMHIQELLQNGSISGASLDLQFNCNFLVTFGILLLLSYVFEYGQELQKLSDETV